MREVSRSRMTIERERVKLWGALRSTTRCSPTGRRMRSGVLPRALPLTTTVAQGWRLTASAPKRSLMRVGCPGVVRARRAAGGGTQCIGVKNVIVEFVPRRQRGRDPHAAAAPGVPGRALNDAERGWAAAAVGIPEPLQRRPRARAEDLAGIRSDHETESRTKEPQNAAPARRHHPQRGACGHADRGEAFVPDPALAKLMALGFDSVVADYYWLQAIQAIGGEAVITAELGAHLER